ncbi:hypothetical protein LEP1GSC036_2610 [Leptospira weilii str. 2006001853]|uniref:Uncharacterized protein n=1 Tax=Leptospira weilii str. 2006001853 TaxID=1001589 RepID=A0A828Z430_9LEPT|nr:hypothetical protein [Leptospira weilii]EKR65772.1 hypothetical protein LEP1GSC036_2610 [Leptospira weilii str. 2006001853]
MTVSERISLLRRSILLSRLYKKDGSRRNHIEIIEVLLSRSAILDLFIQDRKLKGKFSEWSNENLIEEKANNET